MKRILFALFFLGTLSSLRGEEYAFRLDSMQSIQPVVITANRSAVNRNNVPLSITVVDRREIEESSESALLPVLSQRVPGLFVTQRGITGFGVSAGAAGMVNIRGVGQGDQVLMLFDGQPQWAGVFGHALPDTYVASDVERVEVIRGPGSLLYGSNAMGGVVNILTRSQEHEGVTTRLRALSGRYDTQKYLISNGVKKGKFDSFVSLNHDRTDGHRKNSQFDITNGFAKVGYDFTAQLRGIVNASVARYNTHNPGKVTAPAIDNWMKIWRGTASLALENNCARCNGGFRFFYNWGNHKINDGYKDGQPRDYLFRSTDRNTGVQLYESFRLFSGNEFTVGLDYKNWGGKTGYAYYNGTRRDEVDKSVHETAGYAVMQQRLFDRLTLNAGLRYEYNSTYGSEWVPQAGFAWRPFAGNTIKGSFSKGFRSPSLRELYISYAPYSMANPDLKPEEMFNYEVAVGQDWLEGRLHTELTAFYIDGKNLIQPVNRQLTNIGTFYNSGLEFDAAYRVLRQLSFSANYSFLHTNKKIVAAPEHKLFVEGVLTLGDFSLTVNVQSIFGLYLVDGEPGKQEDYTLLNARGAYKLLKGRQEMVLFVKGENLTDTSYSINDGFPMPGIVALWGVDFKF